MSSESWSESAPFLPEHLGGGGAPQAHFDIKRMLRLRLPLIVGVFVALAAPAVFGVWLLFPLQYEASADLRFLALTPRVLSDRGDRGSVGSVTYEKFLNTQIDLIAGNAILSRVLEDPKLRDMKLPNGESLTLGYLKAGAGASIRSNSELVQISFRSTDRESARKIVESIVSNYMEYALGEEANAGGERLMILRKERDARQKELELKLRQISDLQRKIGIPLANVSELGPSETEAYRGTLARAEEDLTHAESQAAQAAEKLAQLKQTRVSYEKAPQVPVYALGVEERVAADPRVASLRQELVRSETQLSVLKGRLAPGSPKLQTEEENHAILRRNVASTESTVRGAILSSLLADLGQQCEMHNKAVEEAGRRKERFGQLIAEHEEEAAEASTMLAELDELRAKTDETRRLLSTISDEISQISIESNAPARVKLVSQPRVPEKPDTGKRLQLMVLAIMGAAGAGVGVGVLRELADQQTRSPQDIGNITRLPVIATIPHLTEERFLGTIHAPLLTADFPHSPTADEFRRILARIIYPPESGAEIKSCLIASPTRGDGKTSLASNLSVSLAQAHRRVLLIDTGTRDQSIEWCYGLDPGPGLSEVLYGNAALARVARQTEFANLEVLGPGFATEALAGGLASRNMMEFLEKAEQDYDHVIVDTPPSLLMSDAKLLAPLVDGVIVVVGVGVSTQGMVRRCLREMEQVDANVIGLVLNGIRVTRGGYLRRNLDLYYGYGENRGHPRERRRPPTAKVADVPSQDDSEPPIMLMADTEEEDRENVSL